LCTAIDLGALGTTIAASGPFVVVADNDGESDGGDGT